MSTVRPLAPGDGAAWQALFSSVAAEGQWIGAEAPVPDISAETEEKYLDSDACVLFLAEVDGLPVGWITIDVDPAGYGHLGMGVIDGHRGRGIGTAMMQAAERWAADHDVERLRLDVFPHNEAAIGLYRKCGFVEVERRARAWPRRNGELWDLIGMERSLAPVTRPR